MNPLVINKTKSKLSIRDFYPLMNSYGDVRYKLKPDGYKFINPSKFEQLSKDMFMEIKIRVSTDEDHEFILLSPLEFVDCDGVVIYNADNKKENELTAKFIKRGKAYKHEWIGYLIPSVGVQERIDYILSLFLKDDEPSTSEPTVT